MILFYYWLNHFVIVIFVNHFLFIVKSLLTVIKVYLFNLDNLIAIMLTKFTNHLFICFYLLFISHTQSIFNLIIYFYQLSLSVICFIIYPKYFHLILNHFILSSISKLNYYHLNFILFYLKYFTITLTDTSSYYYLLNVYLFYYLMINLMHPKSIKYSIHQSHYMINLTLYIYYEITDQKLSFNPNSLFNCSISLLILFKSYLINPKKYLILFHF